MTKQPSMQPVEDALLTIAGAFQAEGIGWGIGASLMLYYRGITSHARDIDLMIAEGDMDRADAILRRIGEATPPPQKEGYATSQFLTYIVGGIEVDAMAGLAIRYGDTAFHCPLRPETLTFLPREDVSLPLTPVEDWFVFYQLMGRTQRVAETGEYLRRQGVNPALLAPWLQLHLPETIRASILALRSS